MRISDYCKRTEGNGAVETLWGKPQRDVGRIITLCHCLWSETWLKIRNGWDYFFRLHKKVGGVICCLNDVANMQQATDELNISLTTAVSNSAALVPAWSGTLTSSETFHHLLPFFSELPRLVSESSVTWCTEGDCGDPEIAGKQKRASSLFDTMTNLKKKES